MTLPPSVRGKSWWMDDGKMGGSTLMRWLLKLYQKFIHTVASLTTLIQLQTLLKCWDVNMLGYSSNVWTAPYSYPWPRDRGVRSRRLGWWISFHNLGHNSIKGRRLRSYTAALHILSFVYPQPQSHNPIYFHLNHLQCFIWLVSSETVWLVSVPCCLL